LFSMVAWNFLIINCYCFKETLLYYIMAFSVKSSSTNLVYFLTTDVTEVFLVYVQLSLYVAKHVTTIFVSFQIFAFLSTGLYLFEYIYLRNVAISILIWWLICIFALNSIIFPTSWDFFFKFQKYLSFQNIAFHFEIKLSEYLTFCKSMYQFSNLLFQVTILFIVLMDLLKTNVFIIKKFRKTVYFLFFLFSTFLTPPEITHQLMTSICVIVIFELTTFFTVLKIELVNSLTRQSIKTNQDADRK